MEIPAVIISILVIDRMGRKPLLVISLLLCGICCIPAGYAETSLKTALVLIGKLSVSVAFACCYIQTVEMYPAVVRTTGLGLCSLAGRLGGLLAPLIALYLPDITFDKLPLIIFVTIYRMRNL